MKKNHEQDVPARLVSRAAGGDGAEDRLAALMRAAEPLEGLSTAARDRVWRSLDHRESRPRSFAGLRWGLAAGVLLTSGVVIAAASAPRWWPMLKTQRRESAPTVPAPLPRAHREARATIPAAPVGEAPVGEAPIGEAPVGEAAIPVLEVAPPARSRAAVVARRAAESVSAPNTAVVTTPPDLAPPSLPAPAPHAIAAPPPPSALANETALLSAALTRLRQHRDAAGALAALDVYDARAPHGTLRREADGARVDALLMLGRDGEALVVLRTLSLQSRGRDQELLVVRGELAAAISCAASVEDFDRVLAEPSPAALVERALHGRATCLARMGDPAASRRDLREYLRRFPTGRFADEARRLSSENDL